MRSSECDVVSLYVLCCTVNGSVCFVCCAFANSLVKQFTMGVVAILLLNVMDVFVCVDVLCWIDHVWYSKECVCFAFDPIERLGAPSICFVCVLYVVSFLPI